MKRSGGCPEDAPEAKKNRFQTSTCQHMIQGQRFLESLRLDPIYFDSNHDRCYCTECAQKTRIADVLETTRVDGNYYEVPKGEMQRAQACCVHL